MTSLIKLRRSAVPGKIPTEGQLDLGEVAINTYDGKMFFKQSAGSNTVVEVAKKTDIGDATITISAGSGLVTGGTFTTNQSSNSTITISHSDTSTQASINNTNGVVIQDVSLDDYGHVTSLGSYDLDNRYYTETEADSRFLNVAGDTMTGDLTIPDKIIHAGNINTAIRFPTDNTFTIETAGVERFRVDANGNIGVSATPDVKVDIQGNQTTAKLRLRNTAGGLPEANNTSSGIELISGNVNTSSTYAPLIKFGAMDPDVTTQSPKFGAFISAQASETWTTDNDSGMHLSFWTAPKDAGPNSQPIERVRIRDSGFVGVGKLNPNTALDVEGTTTSTEFAGGGLNLTAVDKIFYSRSEFTSSTIPDFVQTWGVYHSGLLLYYKRDASGTAIESANGVKGSPLGKATVQHWGYVAGDIANTSPTDAASFIVAAHSFSKDLYFPKGSYGITNAVLTESGGSFDLDTEAHIYAIPRIDTPYLSGHLIYQGYTGTIAPSANTARTPYEINRGTGNSSRLLRENAGAPIAKGATTIVIEDEASAASFSRGDIIEIKADTVTPTNPDEYFIGIGTTSGWGYVGKGEFAQVYSVSGNTVTLATPTRDSYLSSTVPDHQIRIYKLAMIEGLKIRGGKWHGVGNSATTQASENNGFVFFAYCIGGEFHPDLADNFSGSAVVFESCIRGLSSGVFSGPKVSDITNDYTETKWAKAVTAVSSENIKLENAVCYHLRRPFDATTTGGSVVSRDVSQIGVVAHFCNNLISVHQCENFVAIGNVGTCDHFVLFRGKTCNISHNSCTVTLEDTGGDEALIRVGSAPTSEAYTENPNSGDLVFHGNIVNSNYLTEYGIQIRSGYDSLSVSGGKVGGCKFPVAIFGKVSKNTVISGVIFDGPEYLDYTVAPNKNSCVYVLATAMNSDSINKREILMNLKIHDNIFNGMYYDGFSIMGDFSTTGAKGITIKRNTIEHVERRLFDQQGVSGSTPGYGTTANFAEPIVAGDNKVQTQGSIYDQYVSKNAGFAIVEEEISSIDNPGHHISRRHSPSSGYLETNRTYLKGATILFSDPTEYVYGQICTSSGTRGTLSGVTASITAANNVATFNTVENVAIGSFVTITGAGLSANTRVVAIDGLNVTLSEPAVNTVTDENVLRTAPIFVNLASFTGEIVDYILHDNDNNTKFGFPANDTFAINTAGAERVRVTSSGTVGINLSTAPSSTLHVNGDITAIDFNTTSDLNVKENINVIPDAILKVSQLKGVTFNFKTDESKTRRAGVIAQDVEKVLPEAVSEMEDGIKRVSYDNLIGLLIEAIKDQQHQLEDMKNTITEFKNGI